MAIDAAVYPVGLVVAGRPCLVVGGGRVAGRKVAGLVRCGAAVTMVAPDVQMAVRCLEHEGMLDGHDTVPVDVQVRPYRQGEAANFRLVVAATGIAEVDRAVHDDAEAAGVWVNCADDGAHCTVVLPAVHRDGPVTVAVSTAGASPALASWIRHQVATTLGPHIGELASLLDLARQSVHRAGRSTEPIDWSSLLDGPLPDLVRQGRIDEALALLETSIGIQMNGPGSTVPCLAPPTR